MRESRVRLGCELLEEVRPAWLRTARLGLLVNQASVTQTFEPVSQVVRRCGGRLTCLFSPQHGFHAEKQANMIESSDSWDGSENLHVYSLYGEVREPSREMLAAIDVLLIDLQDVGTRVYTYGATLGLCLEAASRAGVKVVVLDRPNPIGGEAIEGNVLDLQYRSFVGRYSVPMRHGLTMGELARFIVATEGLDCDLEIIPAGGWRRGDLHADTGLPWVFPSPNMPSWETALVYPGMVLLEGTNVSEGRGTTLPFHLFGAPFLDQRAVAGALAAARLEGVAFRPVHFEPVFDKWAGQVCSGFQVHVTDPGRFRPYRTALALLEALWQCHGEAFRWLDPPYEYEWEKLPIEILLGSGELRRQLEGGEAIERIEAGWAEGLSTYREHCEACWIYEG